MDFFDVVTTQRAMRRLKTDAIPDTVLQKIMDAAICAPSGGNRQNWSFVVVRDQAKRARLGELYRESWAELMKTPYYRGASAAPPDSREGKMVASAGHLAEHLAEAPVLILACIGTEGVRPTITTGASIYPAVQNLMLAARALGIGSVPTTLHATVMPRVFARFEIPDDIAFHFCVPLGYPQGNFGPNVRRPTSETTYLDRWGAPVPWE